MEPSTAFPGEPADVVRAFEELPAILWAFEGPEHRVVAANRAARASTGHRAEIVGRPVREVLPELEGQQIFAMFDEIYATGRGRSQPELRVLIDRDGDGDLEEGFFTYTAQPALHPDGTVRGLLVYTVETTELVRLRRAAEDRAVASEHRYREQRDIVLGLQRDLLPQGMPVLPRVRTSARYLAAGVDAAAGGDWFDVVPLGDGRVALLVGDVVGNGAPAVAAMGQLRAVAVQALASGAGIAETVARLDGLAGQVPTARGATVCVAVLDPAAGEVRYTSRAHPAPLVLDQDGVTRFLAGAPGGPLGAGAAKAEVHREPLTPGDMVLLYSDGLVERPGRTLADGMARLSKVASAVVRDAVGSDTTLPDLKVDRVCALVVERLALSGYSDDVTLLAAEPVPRRADLSVDFPASSAALSGLRRSVGTWLASLDVTGMDADGLQLVVGEAAANAIEHAYPTGGRHRMRVECRLGEDGVAHLTLSDGGRWRQPTPEPAGRGWGLRLMRSLVDRVEVSATSTGTAVTFHQPLRRAVPLGSAALPGRDAEELSTVYDRPVLRVSGPVDQDSTRRLREAVMAASRGGALPVVLDLTGVSQLASAGVLLLHQLAADCEGLRLVAPAGGTARQVLELTGLGHLL
ncbi:SpoIIE family protein phosphatase [Longispora sp. K20-0274]|uniref:SpoIIE family protein phosphatase n=1 Tax=Longispora sp. K20-0274 TaxID=3088255 RepID=UPI00399A5CDE